SSGGASFLQSVTDVSLEAASGTSHKTIGEDLKTIAVTTAVNAAGGAIGGALPEKIRPAVGSEVLLQYKDEIGKKFALSEEEAARAVSISLDSFAGGFSNACQSLVADAGSTALGEMSFEEFKDKVLQDLIANGIGGAIGGAASSGRSLGSPAAVPAVAAR